MTKWLPSTKENFLSIFYYEFFFARAFGSEAVTAAGGRKGQEFEKCYNFTILCCEADLAVIIMSQILERKGDIINCTILTLQTQ